MIKREIHEQVLAENLQLKTQLQRKEERIAYLERLLYGAKRDKLAQHGPTLFDELFEEALDEKQSKIESVSKDVDKEATLRREKRKKEPTRPAKYRYTGLPEEWRTEYPKGINLDDYDIIGIDEDRILHRTEPRIWVECIKRPILRLKSEKNALQTNIIQAPSPRAIIGGNHVAADFLARLIVDKYTYHIPEYRQVKIYADLGVKLPTSTINNWVHAVANKLYPLYESLCEEILLSSYLQIDEVPWKIADRVGQSCRNGYAWQFRDVDIGSKGTFFYYHKGSRAGEIPRSQLKNFKGAIQTDGYVVYNYFETQSDVTLLGCMAHVRRKFVEAQKTHPAEASQAVKYISLLYTIEENLRHRNASLEEIKIEREEKSLVIMDGMEEWMKVVSLRCLPDDLLGKALDYAYKLWHRLRRYTLDGRYQIDNNAVERGQRASVLGKKNYLFSKNDKGAEDNAVFYSLLESCDVVGVNKLQWLTFVLNKLHKDCSDEDVINMLPHNYKKSE